MKVSKDVFFKLSNWPLWVWAAFATLATIVLALSIGASQSVWFDEAFSIMIAHEPLGKFFHFVSLDTQPPLYYLTLKIWMAIFGGGDFVLRVFSAICGGLASFFALLLAGRMFGKKVAYFCLPFTVLVPLLVRYDFEIRMYSMAAMLCVIGSYLLFRALEAKSAQLQRRFWAGYGLVVLAGVFTFYYTAFVWIGHFIWLTFRRYASLKHTELTVPSDKNRSFFSRRPWLLTYAACVVLFAAWIPVVIGQVEKIQGNFWISPVSYYDVVNLFSIMASYIPAWQVGSWQSVFVFGGILVTCWLVIAAFSGESVRHRWYFGFLGIYLLLPIGLMYLVSLPPLQPVFLERYAVPAVLGGFLLVGATVGLTWLKSGSKIHKVASFWVIALLIFGTVEIARVGNYNLERLYKPNAKSIAAYLRPRLNSNTTAIVGGPGRFIIYSHYLPVQRIRFVAKNSTSVAGVYAMVASSPDRIRSNRDLPPGQIWYVYAGTSLHSPSILANYKLINQKSFGQNGVALYERS